MKKQFFFGSFLTLIGGGLIYVMFRTSTLKMFGWFETIGLDRLTNVIRKLTFKFAVELPDWILFSLPDGLWIFSYVSLMLAIWQNSVSPKNTLWILLIPILVIGSEIGQSIWICHGTF